MHAYLNDRFYADYNENLLLYTTPDEIIRAEGGSAGEEGYVPAFMDNGVILEQGSPKEVFGNPREARTREFLSRYLEDK